MTSRQELQRIYRYRIDEFDNITFVCPNWLRFAKENATSNLTEAAVIGQPIWRYIADSDCRELYRSIFVQVRQHGITASFPFRCDSPTVKRFMGMQISPLPHEHLQFRAQLLREEPQPYCPPLDPEIKRSDQWITMCAWCKRIKSSGDQWIEVSEAVRVAATFVEPKIPNLTHGMCPPCQQTFLESVQNVLPNMDT